MQAIINVKLDAKTFPSDDVAERYQAVLNIVRKYFTRSVGEVRNVQYEGPSGPIHEWTAVIAFEFYSSKEMVNMALQGISRACNQDCIAVLFDDGVGQLIGPKADQWPEFNISHFRRPRMYDLLKEAA